MTHAGWDFSALPTPSEDIPAELARLPRLEMLHLANNKLSGERYRRPQWLAHLLKNDSKWMGVPGVL